MIVHQIIDACLDVFHAVDSKFAVIQVHKFLAKAGGSAHVRRKHPDSLPQQSLIIAAKRRALLPFRAAMETHNVCARRALVLRSIQPSTQFQSIK